MTREELREYVEEQRNLDNIPYHVYSALIDGIDTLEQEPCENKIIDEHYKKGFANGVRTAEWRYNNAIAEIEEYKSRQLTTATGVKDLEEGKQKQIALNHVLVILNKYKLESEDNNADSD